MKYNGKRYLSEKNIIDYRENLAIKTVFGVMWFEIKILLTQEIMDSILITQITRRAYK